MISIVMATYNRADTLPRAIGSVLRQSFGDWELLIVDDGSTDATPKVLEAFDDSRIRVFRHAENRGVAAAKNTGLDHIAGEWFTTLDSDDEMVPEALEVMLACAERTGATAITCNCLDASTGQFTGIGPTADGRLTPEQTARMTARHRGDFWGLTRTSLLGELRFIEGLPSVENTVWLKINRKARRYYLHRALAIVHTEGADRITKTQRTDGLRQMFDVRYLRNKSHVYFTLGEDTDYLRELKKVNPSDYRHLMTRVWAARILHPFLGLLPPGAEAD